MDRAEQLMRQIVEECADCGCCRDLMDTNCHFFPRLHELWDREEDTGEKITPQELRALAHLCHYCTLCPCPHIRQDIITAKTLFMDRDGLPLSIRFLEDVQRVGTWCGAMPWLSNRLLQGRVTGRLVRACTGIHPDRRLPSIPRENFTTWARRNNLHHPPASGSNPKVAYFAGCTATHLFPEVARATVELLERNQVTVTCPRLPCCGMPSMVEGDRQKTLASARETIHHLSQLVRDGYTIVCSCPTCGYMLKKVIPQGAYYSEAYQHLVGGTNRQIKVPEHVFSSTPSPTPLSSLARPGKSQETVTLKHPGTGRHQEVTLRVLDRSTYGRIMKDDGYLADIDPLQRIHVAENCQDLGEYLLGLYHKGGLSTSFAPLEANVLYYPPCHQREMGPGNPYMELLGLMDLSRLGAIENNSTLCCGCSGIMGFKDTFHQASLQLGSRLMEHINALSPDLLVTECLSCRLQFEQMSNYPVRHPVELLNRVPDNQ
ncbi:hypothetical protein DPF_2154 [Desulfoplanes formicivorans]|uniref:Cysteine-rich domain-containing protein n=2 Tax=Desulfoplanes formicivorans TaxID=1592317 RepID=A0A194AJC9_9BACT|nr:hypothetical protein DPF_2154 [Desulfoplanes formicivorans]